jgi:hypothetical protein
VATGARHVVVHSQARAERSLWNIPVALAAAIGGGFLGATAGSTPTEVVLRALLGAVIAIVTAILGSMFALFVPRSRVWAAEASSDQNAGRSDPRG